MYQHGWIINWLGIAPTSGLLLIGVGLIVSIVVPIWYWWPF